MITIQMMRLRELDSENWNIKISGNNMKKETGRCRTFSLGDRNFRTEI